MGCADEREGFTNFLRVARGAQPVAFLVENVPELMENEAFSHWSNQALEIVREFYDVRIALHHCENHRVPQQRKRVSIIGYHHAAHQDPHVDKWLNIPTHEHDKYVPWDAWSEEESSFWYGPTPPPLEMEPISLRSRQRISTRTHTSGLVVANRVSNTVVTTCTSGNSWHRMALVPCSETAWDEFDDLDTSCVSYGALRALQPRHLQLLQSFPPEFVLYGNYRAQGHLLGNAVPPMFAYDVGCALLKTLQTVPLPANPNIAAVSARMYVELEARTLGV
jgi:site-specific DNA-cytosine methylase